jgi:hypothetical protein
MNREAMTKYTKSIVSYFDILGFRKIVAELSPEQVVNKLQALARFSSPGNEIAETFGNTFTNFSDLVLRTVPVDPNPQLQGEEGLLYCELLDLVFVQAELIADGVLLRGSITFGDIYVDDKTVFGPALIRAYELEDQVAIAPRVIVDPEVFGSLEKYPVLRAHAVEDEMQYLCRLLKKDTDGVWFIDYLRAMATQVENQADYLRFVKAHRQLILDRLREFNQLSSVLTKYGWLVTYHNSWVNGLNDDALEKLGASKETLLVPNDATPLLPSIHEDPDANI